MIYRVIISHNQTEQITKFANFFNDMSHTVFVFDSPTDSDIEIAERLKLQYTMPNINGNRPLNRNTGLAYLMSKYTLVDSDVVEFFDGDRVPVRYCYNCLDDWDVLLFMCEKDARADHYEPGLVDNWMLCNPFYSCGFAIKYGAISRVCLKTGGCLFDEDFTGWGCEDQFLGLLCNSLGMKILLYDGVILNGSVGGDAVNHDGYRDSLQTYINKLLKYKIFPHIK